MIRPTRRMAWTILAIAASAAIAGYTYAQQQAEPRGKTRSQQSGYSGEEVRSEEDGTQAAGVRTKAQMKPIGGEALHYKAACKRVEREERRKLKNNVARAAAYAKEQLLGFASGRLGHFRRRGKTREEERQDEQRASDSAAGQKCLRRHGDLSDRDVRTGEVRGCPGRVSEVLVVVDDVKIS